MIVLYCSDQGTRWCLPPWPTAEVCTCLECEPPVHSRLGDSRNCRHCLEEDGTATKGGPLHATTPKELVLNDNDEDPWILEGNAPGWHHQPTELVTTKWKQRTQQPLRWTIEWLQLLWTLRLSKCRYLSVAVDMLYSHCVPWRRLAQPSWKVGIDYIFYYSCHWLVCVILSTTILEPIEDWSSCNIHVCHWIHFRINICKVNNFLWGAICVKITKTLHI